MASKLPLGLPPITPPLKTILPFLQRAEEVRSSEPIVAYWCAYYAAQLGIATKTKDVPSRTLLISLLDCLEQMKTEVDTSEAVEVDAVGSAYVENFAMKVFTAADNEDRVGKATRLTAKKLLAAANFLEVLKTFNNSEITESNVEKIKYAKWKAADIAKAFREGRQPAPGPPGYSEEQDIANQLSVLERQAGDELVLPSTPSGPARIPSSGVPGSAPPPPDTAHAPSPPNLSADSWSNPPPSSDHAAEWVDPHSGSGGSLPSAPAAPPGPPRKAYVSEELEGRETPPLSPGSLHHGLPEPTSPGQTLDSGEEQHEDSTSSELQLPPPPSLPPTAPTFTPPAHYQPPPSPPSLPTAPSHSSVTYRSPPQRQNPQQNPQPPPAHTAPRAPVVLTPAVILQAQKYCRLASSALDYEDAETAKRELRAALAILGE